MDRFCWKTIDNYFIPYSIWLIEQPLAQRTREGGATGAATMPQAKTKINVPQQWDTSSGSIFGRCYQRCYPLANALVWECQCVGLKSVAQDLVAGCGCLGNYRCISMSIWISSILGSISKGKEEMSISNCF